jgi:hypothetical protein
MSDRNYHTGADLVQALMPKETADDLLTQLLTKPSARSGDTIGAPGVVIGQLVALTDASCTPLVTYPMAGRDATARARTVVDLHSRHVGQPVVLAFDETNAPIVLGVLLGTDEGPLETSPGHVEVDADGRRMVVSAQEQLVLRCGTASITLTSAGKVLIHGTYVLSRSSGTNRIKGGSIQLN